MVYSDPLELEIHEKNVEKQGFKVPEPGKPLFYASKWVSSFYQDQNLNFDTGTKSLHLILCL